MAARGMRQHLRSAACRCQLRLREARTAIASHNVRKRTAGARRTGPKFQFNNLDEKAVLVENVNLQRAERIHPAQRPPNAPHELTP